MRRSERARGSVLTCGLKLRRISSQGSFFLVLLTVPSVAPQSLPLPPFVEPRALISPLFGLYQAEAQRVDWNAFVVQTTKAELMTWDQSLELQKVCVQGWSLMAHVDQIFTDCKGLSTFKPVSPVVCCVFCTCKMGINYRYGNKTDGIYGSYCSPEWDYLQQNTKLIITATCSLWYDVNASYFFK